MKLDAASGGPPNWTCSVCGAGNSPTRATCQRCGVAPRAQLDQVDKPASETSRGIRLGLILPICLLVVVSLLGGVWWKVKQTQQARALAAEAESSQAAADRLAQAVERVPSMNARAQDCLRTSRLVEGLKMVDDLLALVDAPELKETKVSLLVKLGRSAEAYELLLTLLEKQSEAPHLHFLAGTLAAAVKDPKMAMSHLGEACRLAPENKAYKAAWAKACLLAGLREPAVATFNKLLADDPQCTACWLDCVTAYYSSGQSQEAITLLQQAIKRFPGNSTYHFAMARVLDLVGTQSGNPDNLQVAASYYRQSLELQPRRNSVAASRYYEITHTRVPPQLEAIRTDEIPLDRRGATLFIQASINGVPGNFVLDTGASIMAITPESLARFRISPISKTASMTTANGTVQAALAYADIDLGQHTIRQALITVLPQGLGPGCDGLFGLDSLSRLGAQLDIAHDRLVIRDEQSEALFGN